MRIAVCLLATGCNFYFGGRSHDAPGPTVDTFSRDCIRTISAGPTLPRGPTAIVITSACTSTSMVENLQFYQGSLESVQSYGVSGARYRSTLLADVDGNGTTDTIGFVDNAPAYVVWPGQAVMPRAQRVDYTLLAEDIVIADLNGDRLPDVVFSGMGWVDAALARPGAPPPTKITLDDAVTVMTTKTFASIAVTQLGDHPAPDIFYIGRSRDGLELGVALQTAQDPPAYTIVQEIAQPAGPHLPLVLADVDGDGIADVIGAAPTVFVRSSKHGTISFLPEGALAIAAGDVDGDGIAEPIFLTSDGASLRRVQISGVGSLTSEHLLSAGGEALAVGDFDADGIDDIALVEKLGRAGSQVVVYRL